MAMLVDEAEIVRPGSRFRMILASLRGLGQTTCTVCGRASSQNRFASF
jgi:hypothetical protein